MAKDNLRSQTNISFVDLLCEGEIQGLVNGAKSIYLNNTQLQNDSGSFNFDGVTYEERKGTNSQTALKLINGVENDITVNTQITKLGGAITKTITDEDVSKVRIKMRFPALFQQADNGDVNGTTVRIKAEVQSNGGGYKPALIDSDYTNAGVTNVTSLHEQCANFATRIKGSLSIRGEFAYSTSDEYGSYDVYYPFTYQIQYRAIGAASWITYETVNVGEYAGSYTDDFIIQNLVANDYEVRINVTSSGGGTPANVTGTLNCLFYQGVNYDDITGKASDGYERDYEIPLYGDAPWDIRITRETDDSTDLKIQNDTYWASYTEIISQKFRYPNSALIGIKYDSSEFSSTPTRGYDVKLKKVQVPSNYDPIRRRYIGIWNGTFQTAWTDNPAWCFYDLLTNTRYGLGNYISASQIDKWTLYTISQYCDVLVDNGDGGTEPRFTCNLYIQTREEAFKVLNDFASIFRTMIYWSNGTITFGQDAPKDPVALFSPANVVGGQFNYSGSSAKTRHTVALVTWNDPEYFYKQKVEYVEDKAGIARYGVLEKEVTAIGCTSRGQARRVGKWLLYSDQYEGETISFSTGADGLTIRPSDIIKIQDPTRGGARYSGRISSATTTDITVDADFTLPSSSTMFVVLPDGSVESIGVSKKVGSVITLNSALSTAPQSGAVWMISAPSVELQTFRILSASESQDGNVSITALKYDSAKYAYVEDNEKLPVRDFTNISIVPTAPATITTREDLYTYQSEVRSKLTVTYGKGVNAAEYRIDYRKSSNNWITLRTSDTDVEILNTTPGSYEIRVWSINVLGKQSATYKTITANVLGKTAPPSNVTGLYATIDPSIGITLDWNDVADLDLSTYEIRKGLSWDTGTFVARTKASYYKVSSVFEGNTTYFVKALDTSKIYSAIAASVVVTIVEVSAPVVTSSFEKDTLALSWNNVTGSLAVSNYEIRYGASWVAGTVIGNVNTTYFRTKINWSGSRTFYIAAKDIAGNYGAITSIVVTTAIPANTSVASFIYTDTALTTATITIDWEDVSPVHGLSSYEITYDSVTKLVNASTITLPADWIGNKDFTIKTVDLIGQKSTGYVLSATKQLPDQITGFRAQVIDNNVLFYWTLPAKTSLPIAHVLLKKGATYASATSIGYKAGEFTTIQETKAGEYTYWAVVVDTDNNESTPVSLTTNVAEPPDFIFNGEFTSTFAGTKSSAIIEDSSLILPVNTTETWEQHFTTRSWTSPSSQISAGYPIFIQPTPTPAFYEETFDYGTILASSKITLTYTGQVIAGSPLVANKISISVDNVTYTDYDGLSEVYATNFRYVKIRITVSQALETAVYKLSNILVTLDAKQKTDANNVSCLSTDTLGTIVNFGKEFVDVISLTATAGGTTPITTVYDFADSQENVTYSVTSNVCTITSTAHGLITGQNVRLYFASGGGINGVYTITGYTANTYTVAMVTANTSGNAIAYPQSFRLYLFNSSGTRVSATASWTVRGF